MREIEIKIHITDKPALLEKLARRGVRLSEPVSHRDQVFGRLKADGSFVHGEPWLRLRTESKEGHTTYIFTLKRSVGTSNLDSIEHETIVEKPEPMIATFKELGFVEYSDLTKTRQKASLGEIELCVDEVEGLGSFMEAEKLCQADTDATPVLDELWQLLASFGIEKSQRVDSGYDVQLREKQGLAR